MQGRLLPPEEGRFQCFPRHKWREEFPLAAAAGLESIEWIYDRLGADVNPIATDSGIAQVRSLSAQHGVAVASLCADYFMDCPFVEAKGEAFADIVARLYWLIERCRRAAIARIVLPFVDRSRLVTHEDEERAVALLRDVLPLLERSGVELHLETALDPPGFARLLAQLAHPMVKVNYDAGNSASLGFDVAEELAAYGRRIGSVHIKDRVLGGGTVPLGTGAADLSRLFAGLRELGFHGDYILQAARGQSGDELILAIRNGEFVRTSISFAAAAAALR